MAEDTTSPHGWPALIRHVMVTVAGGYVVFTVLTSAYSLFLAGERPRFVRTVASGGAILAFGIAAPAFVILTWLEQRVLPPSRRR